MIIKFHQISESPSRFDFQLKRQDFSKVDQRLSFDHMDCQASLARKGDSVLLRGQYQLEITTQCDLCLTPVNKGLGQRFELTLMNESGYVEPEGDVEITLQSEDVDLFDGQEINLTRYFEDQLLLDLPFSIVCSPDCKGLCSICGVNLNETQCQCRDDNSSHPFSVLKDITP